MRSRRGSGMVHAVESVDAAVGECGYGAAQLLTRAHARRGGGGCLADCELRQREQSGAA
jgi:hypothetical protein